MSETVSIDDMIVTSSHETAADMEAALTPPAADDTAVGPDAAPASEVAEKPAQAADKLGKPRNDPRARVEEATSQAAAAKRERDEARREATELRTRLDAMERRVAQPVAAAQEPPKAETPQAEWKRYRAMPDAPKMSQFEGDDAFEDWNAAMSLFVTDKRHDERQQQVQQHRAQQSEVAHFQGFQVKIQEATAADPSFLEKLDRRLTETPRMSALPPNVRPTFVNYLVEQIYRSEVPKELLVHFTAHPEDAQRLSTLHPTQVVREIGKLEARLTPPAASSKTGTAVALPKSQAKPPITPVTGSSQSASDDEDSESEPVEAYIRRVNAKERRSRAS